MPTNHNLLCLLANGKFHSGQQLAMGLGISRATVWNHIKQLREVGLDIYSVRGKGYCLAQPIEMLDSGQILDKLSATQRQALHLDVLWSVASTNSYLMTQDKNVRQICVAEMQSKGRGRRGRQWVSPPGGNIYYSQKWDFHTGPETLSGLSLASAVVMAKVLEDMGVSGVELKWPNDVLHHGKKLAGILLEMSGEASGHSWVVVGIGLNVKIPAQKANHIDQLWTDIYHITKQDIDRNQLVAKIIIAMTEMFQKYQRQGILPFIDTWRELDAFYMRPVEISLGKETHEGICEGVDDGGHLILRSEHQSRHFASGEVTLREMNPRTDEICQ